MAREAEVLQFPLRSRSNVEARTDSGNQTYLGYGTARLACRLAIVRLNECRQLPRELVTSTSHRRDI